MGLWMWRGGRWPMLLDEEVSGAGRCLTEGLRPRRRGLWTFEPCRQQLAESDRRALCAPANERDKRQIGVLGEKRSEGDEEFCSEHGWFMLQPLEFGQNGRES